MDGYQNYLVNDKDELKRLYENKVIEYENVDDVYASKVDFWYYSKYTSFGEGFLDKLEWIGGALKSFGEGICGGVVDVVKGIGTLLWEIGEFAISGITCLVFTGVGCEPPEWASKNINETVDTVKLIMDDPIVILEGIGQGVSDAYEKEGICYCAGYAIGSYVGTKGITKATKVVTGKIKGIRANKELPKVEIENTLDELDEFEKFYDDIYDAQRELNPEYEEFLDDLTKAPDDGIVIESGSKTEVLLLETTKPITGKTNDHHIIPAFRGKSKPYADFISARGIDVDQYTITVDAGKGGMHMNIIHGKGRWNQKWMDFIDNNPNATAKDIYQFAGKMMDDYGLSGYTIHPYGGK